MSVKETLLKDSHELTNYLDQLKRCQGNRAATIRYKLLKKREALRDTLSEIEECLI